MNKKKFKVDITLTSSRSATVYLETNTPLTDQQVKNFLAFNGEQLDFEPVGDTDIAIKTEDYICYSDDYEGNPEFWNWDSMEQKRVACEEADYIIRSKVKPCRNADGSYVEEAQDLFNELYDLMHYTTEEI